MRLLILHRRLSGYFAACLRELGQSSDTQVLLFSYSPDPNAPYIFRDKLNDHTQVISRDGMLVHEMMYVVDKFGPEIVMMNGWGDSGYRRVAFNLKKRGLPIVMGFDNQWKGHWKQWMGLFVGARMLRSFVDVIWVPGERQKWFADKMGYRTSKCWTGVYTCDTQLFNPERFESNVPQKRFLFVGRYVDVKGIRLLLDAYDRYRDRCPDPWELHCAGTGPHQTLMANREGVVNHGFVQPTQLPQLMKDSSAFVLPSHHEPWGVVIHEATSMGLPVVCSDAVGAGVHLVRDYFNGFVFECNDVENLTNSLLKISRISPRKLSEFRKCSRILSQQYSLSLWVETLKSGFSDLNGSLSSFNK